MCHNEALGQTAQDSTPPFLNCLLVRLDLQPNDISRILMGEVVDRCIEIGWPIAGLASGQLFYRCRPKSGDAGYAKIEHQKSFGNIPRHHPECPNEC